MTPSVPLFSVITATFNAQATLPLTVASLKKQTCSDFEWIVVDGNSSDSTVDIARRAEIPSMSLSSEPDSGIYDAMNKGMKRARGKYLIFLNAGDAFHAPETLALLKKTITENNFPGIVYGQTDIVDITGRYLAPRHLSAPPSLTLDSFKQGMVVCHQAFVVLAEIAQPYDLKWSLSGDYEWCIRCLQRSRHNVYADATLIDYLNEGMTTRNHRRSLIERFKIMCYYFGTLPTVLRHLSFIPRSLKSPSHL